MPSTLLGRYEILEEIGRGGMSHVYKARDVTLLRLVAVKVVPSGDDSSFLERLKREAQATALLSHPNIVTIYDVGEENGSAFIVMEYISGRTLDSHMRNAAPPEWPPYVSYLAPCAEALDFAHRRGIVHRDVKPSNIMIRDDGTPIVLDFGIAQIGAVQHANITQTGFVVGTLSYMSPEQVAGTTTGPQADQYALAGIAYTLLAGRPCFGEGLAASRLLYQIAHTAPEPPSQFNPSLTPNVDAALLKALSKVPGQRFGTCQELIAALGYGQTGMPAPAPPMVAPESQVTPNPPAPKSPGSLVLAALPAAVYLWSRIKDAFVGVPDPSPPPPPPAAPSPTSATTEFKAVYTASPQTILLRRAPDSRLDTETLARARARELAEILERRDFESAVVLRGKWLPGIEGAGGELISFSEAARYLGAAQDALSTHVRIEHLKKAERVLYSAGNQLLAGHSAVSRHFPPTLEIWKNYTRDLLAAAQQKAQSELPNPFRAGQPLRPDEGRAVFRGRMALVRNIEAILADADQHASLALLGPRRCGKTSLLQMLPAMLPDCACVFFDLQDNAVATVPTFFEAVVRRAREQVRAQRRLELPQLAGEGTFENATLWFEQLDAMNEVDRFLISIDEFERLEDLFPGDRRDLLRLMGLFRATIQHRRKVRLLVSGVAPFEELGPLWNDHFINVRELRIGHLDEQSSIELLTRPIADFPSEAVPAEVARLIYARTDGQPYLLQLFGSLLINRLNECERGTAEPHDVEAIEEEALSQGRYYFGNTYGDAPQAAREALEALACNLTPRDMTSATRRWLERRSLIRDDGTLRTPVLGAYIRQELGV